MNEEAEAGLLAKKWRAGRRAGKPLALGSERCTRAAARITGENGGNGLRAKATNEQAESCSFVTSYQSAGKKLLDRTTNELGKQRTSKQGESRHRSNDELVAQPESHHSVKQNWMRQKHQLVENH